MPARCEQSLKSTGYALSATLDSGQAFGWTHLAEGWTGVVGNQWVLLRPQNHGLKAHVLSPTDDWNWLTDYLQTQADLPAVLRSFPPDAFLRQAVQCHPGLHILRQDPWVCLASFLLSATKQIVQIQQIHRRLCERFGQPVATPHPHPPAFAFPTPKAIAAAGEHSLRECRMGFRARYLHEAARRVAERQLDLYSLRTLPLDQARARLMELPGVGRKIADCVLLFSCDQARAFPIDVWIARVLRTHYFQGRSVPLTQLQAFAEDHFGPWAGYAQQYLFHYARRPKALSG